MKTKIISGAITLAILLWTASLFFSKVTLLITLTVVLAWCLLGIGWLIYEITSEQVREYFWRKEKKRRGFK